MTWALRTALDLETVNLHLAVLLDAGLLGMVEQDGVATAYFPAPVEDLPVEGGWDEVAERDWLAVWREGLDAVTVGALTITPPWIDAGLGAIVIEPGQAFGTGHHETTTGCLAALQELDLDGRAVLDVGTGSGILAIAAARLGAGRVVAIDVDPLAVGAARGNAARNGAAVEVSEGSVEVAPGRFDVLVANLDTTTLSGLAGGLAQRLAPGGTLVASGVSIERQDEALAALDAAGLAALVRPGREWVVLVARRPADLH
jgi:ribosomal protein L11 methyltransferase